MPDKLSSSEREQRLEQVLTEFLQAIEAGQSPERDALLSQHPDLADDLRSFVRNRNAMERLAEPLGKQSPDLGETIDPEGPSEAVISSTTRYFGDYELLEEIARGGMGVVYRARHLRLGRVVAVKLIRSGELADEEERRRFHAEAFAAATLDHPHIVALYEVGEHDGQPWFSMQLVEGGSLTGLSIRSFREEAQLVATVARAVHHAHQRGVLHRDLKPANILLDAADQPHVADFGLARRKGEPGLTQTGAILGTPAYMAPEQAQARKDLTTAVDVYSLGAILHERFTGRPPFVSEDLLELLQQVATREPASPRTWNASIPFDLGTICLKCLQKEPARRYESAAALADDLDRWLRGEPILARPAGPAERAWRWCGRNPAVASLIGAVALSLLLGASVASVLAVVASDRAALATRKEGEARQEAEEANAAREEAERAKADRERQFQLTRENLLTAQLRHVESLYERDPGQARELLHDRTACPNDLRDPAWRFFEHACRRWQGTALVGHTRGIYTLAYSPDGTTLASGSLDRTVRLWNLATGKERACLTGHAGAIRTVTFSRDGRLLASRDMSGVIKFWDPSTGKPWDGVPRPKSEHRSFAFSPDGKLLALSANTGEITIWDLERGRQRVSFRGQIDTYHSLLSFSSDGKTLATGNGGILVEVWNLLAGTKQANFEVLPKTESRLSNAISSLALSPDGKLAVTASSVMGRLKLWDAVTGQRRFTLQGDKPGRGISTLAFSPDGRLLATAEQAQPSEVKLWDVNTGTERASLGWHTKWTSELVFSPDGRSLATSSWWGTIKIWDVHGGRERMTLRGDTDVRGPLGGSVIGALAFSPDGKHLASGDNEGRIQVWNLTGPELLAVPVPASKFGTPPLVVALSRDGRTLAMSHSDHTIRLWDVATRRERVTLRGHTEWVTCLAFNPEGTLLASADGGKKSIRLWDVGMEKEKAILGDHRSGTYGLTFSPDGTVLASADNGDARDPMVRLWDVGTGRLRTALQGPNRFIECVAFSQDGTLLAAGGHGIFVKNLQVVPGEIWVWEVARHQVRAILKGNPAGVNSVAFSPDGKTLASASGGWHIGTNRDLPGDLKIWDLATGKERAILKGHSSPVRAVAFSPDGKTLVSGAGVSGLPGELKLWHLSTGQVRANLPGHRAPIWSVVWSTDGRFLASSSADSVKLWSLGKR